MQKMKFQSHLVDSYFMNCDAQIFGGHFSHALKLYLQYCSVVHSGGSAPGIAVSIFWLNIRSNSNWWTLITIAA